MDCLLFVDQSKYWRENKRGTFINAGAVVNRNAIVNEFCQIDCNAVVGANAEVPSGMYLNHCQAMIKVGKPEKWSFSE